MFLKFSYKNFAFRVHCFERIVEIDAAESFFSTLNTELTRGQRFLTHDQAKLAGFEYIEVWYNRRRQHSTVGYLSPVQCEEQFEGQNKASNILNYVSLSEASPGINLMRYPPAYPHSFLSMARYWMASATWASWIFASPSRSATVRASFRIRS